MQLASLLHHQPPLLTNSVNRRTRRPHFWLQLYLILWYFLKSLPSHLNDSDWIRHCASLKTKIFSPISVCRILQPVLLSMWMAWFKETATDRTSRGQSRGRSRSRAKQQLWKRKCCCSRKSRREERERRAWDEKEEEGGDWGKRKEEGAGEEDQLKRSITVKSSLIGIGYFSQQQLRS